MSKFDLPGLKMPLRGSTDDPLSKYRIKPDGLASPATSSGLATASSSCSSASSPAVSPLAMSDSARRDEEELRELSLQLSSFNKKMKEDPMEKYKIKTNNTESKAAAAEEEERRKLEEDVRQLLNRKQTLEMRRKQRDEAKAGAGLERYRIQNPSPSVPATTSAPSAHQAPPVSTPAAAPTALPAPSPVTVPVVKLSSASSSLPSAHLQQPQAGPQSTASPSTAAGAEPVKVRRHSRAQHPAPKPTPAPPPAAPVTDDDKKSVQQVLAEEENFLWNNLARFAGDK